MVKGAKEKIIESQLYTHEINSKLAVYNMSEEEAVKLTEYLNKTKIDNTELLYNRLFHDLMAKSSEYFLLPKDIASLLCTKFVEIVIFSNSSDKDTAAKLTTTKSLSEKEIAGMQYLGGYVLRKLYFQVKNGKLEQKSQVLDMILSATKQVPGDSFVSDLSRGGLWEISDKMTTVLSVIEKYFCINVPNMKRKMELEKMEDELMNFKPLRAMFHSMIDASGVSISENAECDTIASILALYLRVRTFSMARNTIDKSKLHSRQKKSQ